jgi:predicted secreted protein
MASEAFAGVGTKFQRWDGAAWQDIAEVNSIDGPGMTKDVLEVTSLDTDAGYNEFITGFAEGGTLTLDMNFTRETYELMKDDFESDEVRSYRIQLPDYDSEPSTFTIEGLVIELPITMTADDKVTADVVIQITSQVVLDVGSTVPAEDSEIPGSTYDSDLETYWTGLSTPLSTAQKDRLDVFVKAIKTGLGITTLAEKFGVFYVFHNETAEAALRNLVTRAHDGVAPTGADLPQFTPWFGFVPTYNSGQCIDTQFNPEVDPDSAVLSPNDVAIGHYIINDIDAPSTTRYSWGNGIYNQVIQRYGASGPDVVRGNLNGGSMQALLQIDSTKNGGYLVLSRVKSGEIATSLDDDSPSEIASNAAPHFPNQTMIILRSRDAAGALTAGYTQNGVGFWHMGGGLTHTEKDIIDAAYTNYLGASV